MYRLAFTTLACPAWSWDEVLDRAVEYGYEGVELRGVEGEMDLPRARPFTPENLAETKRDLEARGLSIPCLDTSCRLHERDTESNLDEARRAVDLAAKLDAPYIRVFGDKIPDDEPRDVVLDRVAEGLTRLGEHAQPSGVQVLIESHGDFADTRSLAEVLGRVAHPNVGVLWDVHHPWRFHGEPLEETFERLGDRVAHTHLKDSRLEDGEVRYNLVGEGETPVLECLQLLHRHEYTGWVSLEWEKKWHPEIEPPEVALPAFTRVIRELERQATS